MTKPKNLSKQINEQLQLKIDKKNKNNFKANTSYSLYGNLWSRVIEALDNPIWHNLYNKLSFNVLKRLKDRPRGKTTKGKVTKKSGRGIRK